MPDARTRTLYVLDYLLDRTDEGKGHIVHLEDIVNHLHQLNIPAERKSVSRSIKALEDYGIDVIYDPVEKGYRILSREFDLQELQILIDCVLSSKFLTQKVARRLVDKLKKKASVYDRPKFERRHYLTHRVRSMNDSVFYHLDDLHEAIANDCQISFRYYTFAEKKQKLYRHNGELYYASPYALIWNDDNYYLVAYNKGKIKHFRIDKMEQIQIVEASREGAELYKALDIGELNLRAFSMYGGTELRTTIVFHNHLSGVVVDRFGTDIMMLPVPGDANHFSITIPVEVSPQFFGWICGLGNEARITYPPEVVQRMKDFVKSISDLY